MNLITAIVYSTAILNLGVATPSGFVDTFFMAANTYDDYCKNKLRNRLDIDRRENEFNQIRRAEDWQNNFYSTTAKGIIKFKNYPRRYIIYNVNFFFFCKIWFK